MTSPHPDQPDQPDRADRADRRTLPYPGDEAITAARNRAHQVFAQMFTALGAGRHRLHYAALDVDGLYALASVTVDVTNAPAWHLDADQDEFTAVEAAVTAALEGSCTVLATLVVETGQDPIPAVYGWRIERGWLHAMNPVTVYAAVRPCASGSEPVARVYPAPFLPDPSVTG
ncbi:hypothetical protein [Streptomyces bobili]|uniref:hypothetical protein n=1 Tax=Streptomyces bobili TaxID=67280 RepID=UPI003717E146